MNTLKNNFFLRHAILISLFIISGLLMNYFVVPDNYLLCKPVGGICFVILFGVGLYEFCNLLLITICLLMLIIDYFFGEQLNK